MKICTSIQFSTPNPQCCGTSIVAASSSSSLWISLWIFLLWCLDLQVIVINPSFMKYTYDKWTEGKGRYPSTGFLAIIFALHYCDEVRFLWFSHSPVLSTMCMCVCPVVDWYPPSRVFPCALRPLKPHTGTDWITDNLLVRCWAPP